MFYYFWKKRILSKFVARQNKVLVLEKEFSLLTDSEIQTRFNFWREKIQNSKKNEREKLLDECVVPIFALVREVIRRQIGLLLFPTQIFGGLVLHEGNIAQMNTGEGKTLTAFLPICLNALTGKSVFVVTVNEYLAQRDWQQAKPVLDFFGIPSGVNLRDCSAVEKKDLYHNCTVIYTTSSELGFDYLRNNLVTNIDEKRKQDYYYAIIDEVDSILIDEAQNPLIISRPARGKGKIHPLEYQLATKIASLLVEKKDYIVNQKERNLWLTPAGIKKGEKYWQIDNLFAFQNHRYNSLLFNALKVKHFYHKNIDYVVKPEERKIELIDALTGRLVPNRVYGAGIHQAIESKENLLVSPKSQTIATITYQNFFRLFTKLAGMTGTAQSEAKEFREVYGMEVISVPPYRRLIRQDHDALIFFNRERKYQSIIRQVKKNLEKTGRPILIICPSVEVSEQISSLLIQERIFHNKLNAVNHEEEAKIIAEAGKIGVVTVATNMAGRGTDISLDQASRQAGGLLVIIAEMNSILRIDNQARGRSGRQGDPGETQPYIALDDDLLKNLDFKNKMSGWFGQRQLQQIFHRPLSGKLFNYLISEPQESLRNIQAANRQHTLNYDLLINRQRKIVYSYREKLLTSPNPEKILDPTGKIAFGEEDQKRLRPLLLGRVDEFWSEYLECLNKISELVKVRHWLPQDPQEAFFWETMNLFRQGFQKLKKDLATIAA